jgi:hypothetical protein
MSVAWLGTLQFVLTISEITKIQLGMRLMFMQIQLNLVASEGHTGVWSLLFPFMDSPCSSLNVFCCSRSTAVSVMGIVCIVHFLK